ncbi:hypothetical protein H1R20_g13342, partial [Candolleomyces eurysporus]
MSSSSLTPTGTSQTKNPISLRLYKVLSTNFDDLATREALGTLSDLYGASGSNSAETYPGEYAAKARRNLRRDMENKLAESSHHFVKALGEVDLKLSELQVHIQAMHTACAEAEGQLQSTNEASKAVLERAGNLRDERQEVEDKKSIISLFLSKFTLSDDEVEAITSRDVPVGSMFFAAMDKTERIREDCRVLMAGEDGPSTAGLDIMSSTSTYLEQGYDKILRYLSNEFRSTSKDDPLFLQLEVSPVTREAVLRLKKRQELLTESLTLLSQTRQTSLLSSFLTALTRGGPSGLPRPIELHAHDPLRYVGDMLAWVHQAIAAEREFLESLFGVKGDGRMVGSVRSFAPRKGGEEAKEGEEVEEWIQELMDLAVVKLCVPLKNRVLQTVRSQESSIVSYKVANLLQFYLVTMSRTVGPEAVLTGTLREITQVSYQVFETSIETQSRALLQISLDPDDPSLTPPLFILDHAQILREVMNVYQSSVLEDDEVAAQDNGGDSAGDKSSDHDGVTPPFQKILDLAVDPIIESAVMKSEEKKKLRPRWDARVYVVNCLTYVQSVLEPFVAFTRKKQEGIQRVLEQRVREIVDEHFTNLLEEAGLLEVYVTCKNPPTDEPLSHLPPTSPAALLTSLQTFSSWLSTPTLLHSPRLSHLTLQKLHDQIHREALKRIVKAYEKICEEVGKEGIGTRQG